MQRTYIVRNIVKSSRTRDLFCNISKNVLALSKFWPHISKTKRISARIRSISVKTRQISVKPCKISVMPDTISAKPYKISAMPDTILAKPNSILARSHQVYQVSTLFQQIPIQLQHESRIYYEKFPASSKNFFQTSLIRRIFFDSKTVYILSVILRRNVQ